MRELYLGDRRGRLVSHPLPSPIFRLRSALPVTGVLAVGGVDSVRGGRTRLDYWGGNIQIPVCKRMSHLNFPPKLCSNSIFKPQPAGTGGARKPTYTYSGQSLLIVLVLSLAAIWSAAEISAIRQSRGSSTPVWTHQCMLILEQDSCG